MALPFFYLPGYEGTPLVNLNDANSRHVVSVLRMEAGEKLHLTDGNGLLLTAILQEAHKKKAVVEVLDTQLFTRRGAPVIIGISLIKNVSRLEWFLEKATEIGVAKIIPLLCQRTEKQHFRHDRMQQILISAMLQSQQVWLPELETPKSFHEVVTSPFPGKKWIAHCLEANKSSLRSNVEFNDEQLLVVGPEGDFTHEEILLSMQEGFTPVTLGETRLRTETAGLVGATLLCVQ